MSADELSPPVQELWKRRLRTVATLLRDVLLCVLVVPALCLGACFAGPLVLVATRETHYAPGYSEAKFSEVAVGQSREEVAALLGEPLRKWGHDTSESWSYSESPHDTHYWCRVVVFDATGHVSKVHAELYVD